MQKKRLLESFQDHPLLLILAQKLLVLWPSETKQSFFWDTLYFIFNSSLLRVVAAVMVLVMYNVTLEYHGAASVGFPSNLRS